MDQLNPRDPFSSWRWLANQLVRRTRGILWRWQRRVRRYRRKLAKFFIRQLEKNYLETQAIITHIHLGSLD